VAVLVVNINIISKLRWDYLQHKTLQINERRTTSCMWRISVQEFCHRLEVHFHFAQVEYGAPPTESQNHGIFGVGRDLCGSSSPTPVPKQGHLSQAAQDLIQAGLEYLQRRRLHNLPGQPVPPEMGTKTLPQQGALVGSEGAIHDTEGQVY